MQPHKKETLQEVKQLLNQDEIFVSNRRVGGMTYKNHLDDEIILIGTLKSVVLWRKKKKDKHS